MDENGIALLGGILVAAFIYFLYTKVKAARNKPASTGTGGGKPRKDYKNL